MDRNARDERDENEGESERRHQGHTSASALPEVENGLTWYQNVYSHSHT